jgi:hypothetical protein
MKIAPLMEAFVGITFGRDEPDEVAMASEPFEDYRVNVAKRTLLEFPDGTHHYAFMGAKVILDPKLPKGVIEIRNTQHLGDPKFNLRLENLEVEEPKSESV